MKNKKFDIADFLINFFLVALMFCVFGAVLILAIGAIGALFQFSAILGWLVVGLLLIIGVISYFITINETF